jgi:hypothetical protein
MAPSERTKVRDALARALSVADVNQLGRETGQAIRLRTVTPHRLFLALVSALARARVESLADLLRAFNHQEGVEVASQAFDNRLARRGFAAFMRGLLARLVDRLRLDTLTPEGPRAVARLRDIVMEDGSSFARKAQRHEAFPGRCTTFEPAAVEIHATYRGVADEVCAVQVAPDKEAERQGLPDPATLTDCRLWADRGYPGVPYFEAVRAQGGSCIVRLTRSHDPWVCGAWVEGDRAAVPTRVRLSRFLAPHAGRRVDLDVEYERGTRILGFRVVVIPGRDTANPHIAEGLLGAGLCAAVLTRFLAHAAQRVGDGTAMSTRRVAMGARHILDDLVTALRVGVGLLGALRRGLTYLLANARRAHPDRDRRIGRLRAGLAIVEPA